MALAPHPIEQQALLTACLNQASYDRLRRIGRRLHIGLKGAARNRKANWIAAIHAGWSDPNERTVFWRRLSPEAQAAARRLNRIPGLPRALALNEWGELRPLHELTAPLSPTEELYLAGLLYGPQGEDPHTADRFALPADFTQWLSAIAPWPAPSRPSSPSSQAQTMPDLLLDLGQLLVFFCQPEAPRLLHNRWLPPDTLAAVTRRLARPPALDPSATHKRTPALRNLFFWAGQAQLIADGRLTPLAWAWLDQGPALCLRDLWNAWLADSSTGAPDLAPNLRAIYLQPAADWSPRLRRLAMQTLAEFEHPFHATAWTERLLRDPALPATYFNARPASLTDMDATLHDLLATTLVDLGIVQVHERDAYRLLPAGRWLLGADDAPAPVWRWSRRAHLTAEQADGEVRAIAVETARAVRPLAQACLALFAEPSAQSAPETCLYRLTPATVARAAAAGHGLPQLMRGFETLHMTLSADQTAALWRWWRRGRDLTVQILPVVRVRSAERLAALYQNPAIRRHLGEVLGPTLALCAGEPSGLLAALETAGVHPATHLLPPSQGESQPAATLWLAGQLYLLLGEFLPLPAPLAEAELAHLYRQLDARQQAALELHLADLRARLQLLLDNLPYLPPPVPTDPVRWIDRIDRAIDGETPLVMTYHSAGRNLETRRRILPLWRETHHSIDYVRARCIDSDAILIFRLDRILALE